jgi:hypothetical protein
MATEAPPAQDNDRTSTGNGGSSTSIDNPLREWRPWACHIPCCGQFFANSQDLATHLAHCKSPVDDSAYIGSLVNLMRRNGDALRKDHLRKDNGDSAKSVEDLSKAQLVEKRARIEKIVMSKAGVAETRSGIEKVNQGMDNT